MTSLLMRKGGPANSLFAVSRFFGESFFLSKAGHIGIAVSVRGKDPSNVTVEMLEASSRELANALRSLPEEVRIYQYLVKRNAAPIEISDTYPSEVVTETVRARRDAIESRGLYSVDLYWVFLYESGALLPKKNKGVKAGSVFRALLSNLERDAELLKSRVQAFLDETKRQLGAQILDPSGTFQLLRRLANLDDKSLDMHPSVPDDCIDNFLLDETPEVHREGLRLGGQNLRILSTRAAVTQTSANMLKEIWDSKCGVIICLEYKRVPVHEALSQAAKSETHFKRAAFLETLVGVGRLVMAKGDVDKIPPDAAAAKNAEEAGDVLKRLNQGDSLGKFSATVILHSEDSEQLQDGVAATIRAFGRSGGSLYRETYNALHAWQSIFPGNSHLNFRQLWMLQSNVAEMSLAYAPSHGENRNEFLQQEYLLVAETNSHTPYYLNLHWGEVANTLAFGMTGSGKSVLANTLLDHLQKYDPRVMVLDMGGSYRQTCRKHGGSYVSLDFVNKTWSANPFRLPYTHGNVEFIDSLVRVLMRSSGYVQTYKDDQPIRAAVEAMYALPEDERRLGKLDLPDYLRDALYLWIGDGPYASVFDNLEDNIRLAKFQVFDMSGLENYPRILKPLMFYMFRRWRVVVEDPKLRKTFKLLLSDETWKFTDDDICLSEIVLAGKTYRKHNAGLMLFTQSTADLEKVNAFDAIKEVCSTKILLPNPEADFSAYAEKFHLNASEVESFRRLKMKQQFMLKKGDEPGVVLNLILSPIELAMYGNSAFENARRDEYVSEFGFTDGLKRFAAAGAK